MNMGRCMIDATVFRVPLDRRTKSKVIDVRSRTKKIPYKKLSTATVARLTETRGTCMILTTKQKVSLNVFK